MVLKPEFESFPVTYRKHMQSREGPTISVQRRGAIALNREAFDALGCPESVELLFDPQQRIIGFHKVPSGNSLGTAVTTHASGSTYLVNARAFCVFYGIDLSEARLFAAEMVGSHLAADIKTPLQITTRHSLAGYNGMGERVANRGETPVGSIHAGEGSGDAPHR